MWWSAHVHLVDEEAARVVVVLGRLVNHHLSLLLMLTVDEWWRRLLDQLGLDELLLGATNWRHRLLHTGRIAMLLRLLLLLMWMLRHDDASALVSQLVGHGVLVAFVVAIVVAVVILVIVLFVVFVGMQLIFDVRRSSRSLLSILLSIIQVVRPSRRIDRLTATTTTGTSSVRRKARNAAAVVVVVAAECRLVETSLALICTAIVVGGRLSRAVQAAGVEARQRRGRRLLLAILGLAHLGLLGR